MIEEREWKTRKDRIDRKLQDTIPSWTLIQHRPGLDTSVLNAHAVSEYPTASGHADYALFVKGQLLGIIEAKKVGIGPANVLEQAKRYARGAFDGPGSWNGYRVPFLYATNGEIIHHLDVRSEKSLSRQIARFHTPDALWESYQRSPGCSWFEETPINIEKLRPYQRTAIEKIEAGIAHGKRAMLVAMATGTGKTFLTVAQIYRLLESKSFKRILFLVDRRALAAQAVREFSSFLTPRNTKFDKEYEVFSQRFHREDFDDDKPFDPKVLPAAYLMRPQETHTFVYVCTIQRMAINLFGCEGAFHQDPGDPDGDEDETDSLDIPIHAFDVVIADECHRGYTASDTATWRAVLDHFDAVKIGLTATPAPHTLSLFKDVVFRYTTDEAVEDGWLVDYDAVRIHSDVRIKGAFLKEGEQVGLIDTDTGREIFDQLEDEREYSSEQIEKDITAPDSNRKIIEEIAKYARKHQEEEGRFPKILIFAANDLTHTSHADQLVRICREVFGRGEDFVQKITGSPSVDRPLQRIREFRNRPLPQIAVTVDMLTTGVDIPKLEFLVFLRPVKSRILWVQMLGRGTRRCDDIGKKNFTIFDCFGGSLIEYFRNATDFSIEIPQKDPIPLSQVIENIYRNIDRSYNTRVLIRRLHRIARDISGDGQEQLAAYIPGGDLKAFAAGLNERLRCDFLGTMNLLRNPDFQKLLIDYPRKKRSFLVGYEVEDNVSSEVMIRAGSAYQKPEDYLKAFSRFVRDNPEKIGAISILLNKPKGWKTEALMELRQKLARADFPEEQLRKAHQLVYGKALADIISMVKHAAKEQEPLLTAGQRAQKALDAVMAGKSFDEEQQKWLGLIREHLAENLTLDIGDFDRFPIFEQRGGAGKARKIFNRRLEPLIEQVNSAIAA